MSSRLIWQRLELSNGLRVLFFPRESANTTQLSVAVEYGSNYENEKTAGSAHFIEHMLAGGSEKRILMSRGIESVGGAINFYTDREYTMSTIDILPESLLQASKDLAELLFDPTFEEEKLSSERKIILNELAEVADEPSEKVEELLLKSLFTNHPVMRPIGGYKQTIRKLTLNQLSSIHKANYQPEKTIVMLTGKIDQKALEQVPKFFTCPFEQKAIVRQLNMVEASEPVHEVIKKKSGISQSYLSIGAKTVYARDKNAPVLDLISMILAGGASSRLFVKLREEKGLTYDVASTHSKGLDFGYFTVECAVNTKKTDLTRKLILEEFVNLQTEKVAAEELERNKRMILGGLLRGLDSPEECQDILAFMEIQFHSEKALCEYLAKIKAVTSQDIADAANIFLQEQNLSIVILKP